jgi:hypothetical protein
MKRIFYCALCTGIAFCQGLAAPPGYGVMGVPPPGYGNATPPPGYGAAAPSAPAYPNSLPPPSVTPGVTPPPGYSDPYAGAPQPGAVSSYAPQGAGGYNNTPTMGAGAYSTQPQGPSIINFKNIEAFYRYLAPKQSQLSGANTIGAMLTVSLMNPFYLKFGASWGSAPGSSSTFNNAAKVSYNFASVQAGAGFHTALINEKLIFVAEAGLIYANLKSNNTSVSFSDGSIYIRPALRYKPLDWLELQAGVTVSSADKYDSKTLDFTSYFRLLPMFDVGVGADFGNISRAFRTSLRLRW